MASSSSSLPDLRASASSRPRMVRDLSLKGTAGHAQRRAAPVQTFNRAERWPRPGHDDLTPRKLAGPEVASARTGPAFTIGKSKVRELRDADEGQPRKLAEPHDSSVVLHKMSRAPAFSIGKGGREVAAKMLSKHSSAPSMLGAARLHHPAVPSMAEIRHFAARLRQIESLDGWREDPDLSAMWDIYFQSFEEIRMADVEEDLEPFTAVVRKLKERQRKALPLLGKAVHRRSRMQTAFSASTNEWMERFLTSRIGTEMLTSQYIAIINQVSQGKDQLTGIVDPHVSPEQVCKAAAEAAKQLCLSHMGMAPDIEIDVRVKRSRAGEISFSYIPIYLRYILLEVLKNSCQATVRTLFTSLCAEEEPRPVKIVICSDDNRVAIRISDRAGGIPFDVGEQVWDFGFTGTSANNAADPSAATALGGFGIGLPLARLYANYLGGSLSLVSLPEYGVDTYLFLPRIDTTHWLKQPSE